MSQKKTLEMHSLVVGPFQCNCTILICRDSKEAIVIDAGDEGHLIEAKLKSLGDIRLKYSLHTHAHLDHIGAVGTVKSAHPGVKIAVHRGDEWLYNNLVLQGNLFGFQYETPPPIDHFVEDTEVLELGKHRFEVLHTPGHSPGGICLHFKEGTVGERPVLFSGDTLFESSIGRTDLWGGDHKLLVKSIKERLFTLDSETQIFPGHGGKTEVGVEAKTNPFL